MTTPRSRTVLLLALPTLFAVTTPLAGQIRASERGSVSQTVDGTIITIDYSRPQARGRTLFGGEVPWGRVWTGANWATTLSVTKDVTINGHAVGEGTYSVWFEVQPETWTVIFDPEPRRFHLFPPSVSDDQVRFAVTPGPTEHHEMLSWSFPAVRPTGANLEFAWGTTAVTFDIGVQPSRPLAVAPEVAARYTGKYRLERLPPLGTGEVAFDIEYRDGRLVADWEAAPNPNLRHPFLVPLGSGMFAAGETMNGELFDVVMDAIFEFTPLEGRAETFELRAVGDNLWGTGRRVSND